MRILATPKPFPRPVHYAFAGVAVWALFLAFLYRFGGFRWGGFAGCLVVLMGMGCQAIARRRAP